MADKASGKVLWILPKSNANEFVGALVVTVVLSLLWSWVLSLDAVGDYAWLQIILWLVFAAVIGWFVGMVRGDDKQSTLWIAAGFTALGVVLTQGFASNAAAGVDGAFLQSLGSTVFAPEVSGVYLVLGIIAAAFAAIGSKSKM